MGIVFSIVIAAAVVAGCGGGVAHDVALPAVQNLHASPSKISASGMSAFYPQSQSPASFKVAPMPHTRALSDDAMANAPRNATPQSIGPLSWLHLPGAAVSVAGGSSFPAIVWALSTSPAGVNKSIWYWSNGTWTNIPGSAASIAVDASGHLFAVNGTTGGVYYYAGETWYSLGGGARSVTTGADGAVYVLSNARVVNGNSAIWKYFEGGWTQQPGSGSQLAGSFDPNTYSVSGAGTLAPNGYFVINSSGGLYYYSPGIGYVHFSGAASGIAPIVGGFFELKSPASAGGEGLSYFDYGSGTFTAETGTGVSVASGTGTGGPGSQLYVVNSANAVYTAPANQITPSQSIVSVSPASVSLYYGPGSGAWQLITVSSTTTATPTAYAACGSLYPYACEYPYNHTCTTSSGLVFPLNPENTGGTIEEYKSAPNQWVMFWGFDGTLSPAGQSYSCASEYFLADTAGNMVGTSVKAVNINVICQDPVPAPNYCLVGPITSYPSPPPPCNCLVLIPWALRYLRRPTSAASKEISPPASRTLSSETPRRTPGPLDAPDRRIFHQALHSLTDITRHREKLCRPCNDAQTGAC